MPTPYLPIEERLTRYYTGLTNARDVPELQSRVALYGLTPTKLDELLALREEALALHLAQQTEYDEQHTATQAFEAAWQTAQVPYMRLIKLGRIIFKDNYAAYVKLTLNQERKYTFSGWLTQARKFFTNCLADPALVAQYALYNSPQATLEAVLALVDAAEQANVAQAKETGEAQQATRTRDEKQDELDRAMSDVYALSRLACEEVPQLLEMMEIVVSDGFETKPPVVPDAVAESPASGMVTG